MKRYFYYTLIICIILLQIACGSDDDASGGPSIICPEPQLTIKNDSEYELIQLIKHSDIKYYDESNVTPSETIIATNIASLASITHTVAKNESFYFTFKRDITSTSSYPIAVTTQNRITFYGCYKYTLYILEESFFIGLEYFTE